jgi:hypothetical protein
MWSPGSTTGKTGGTGDSIDLGIIDEAWSRPDARTELGMRPAMLTRQDRQLWRISMVPGPSRGTGDARVKVNDSAYLFDQMEKGRERVKNVINHRTAYFEWSAPLDADPGDPRTWRACMPGLRCNGGIVPETSIASDYKVMDVLDFQAEYLGWPHKAHVTKWTVIGEDVWEALWDPESTASGRVVFGADSTPDHTRASIAMCGIRVDGDWHLEVIEPGTMILPGPIGDDWLETRLVELCEKHDPLAVVIDPRGPAADVIAPLKSRGINVLTPNGLQMAAQASRFFKATGQSVKPSEDTGQRLHHLNQAVFNNSVAVGKPSESPSSGSFTWVRVGSPESGPLIAANLAMHGCEMERLRDYDVEDSVW